MSYPPQQPPVTPGYDSPPPQSDWTPIPPKKSGRATPWLLGALGALLIVVVALVVALASRGDKPTAGAPHASPPLPQDPCGGGICATKAADANTPDPAYTPYRPKPSDFKITAKITSKECFGSAGCNVTFRPNVTYVGIQPLDDDASWLVVYEINGVEDAPQVGNFELAGENMTFDEQSMSTPSSKSKITLKVTSVEAN